MGQRQLAGGQLRKEGGAAAAAEPAEASGGIVHRQDGVADASRSVRWQRHQMGCRAVVVPRQRVTVLHRVQAVMRLGGRCCTSLGSPRWLSRGRGVFARRVWVQASRSMPVRASCSQAWLIAKTRDGNRPKPVSFPVKMRSSTLACARWRASRYWIDPLPGGVSVAMTWWRQPSMVSNKVSWAPGCGRSRRAMNRVPSGNPSAVNRPVISQTSACSRRSPSTSTAPIQSGWLAGWLRGPAR